MISRKTFEALLGSVPHAAAMNTLVENVKQDKIFKEASALLEAFIVEMGRGESTRFSKLTDCRDAAEIVAKALVDRGWKVILLRSGNRYKVAASSEETFANTSKLRDCSDQGSNSWCCAGMSATPPEW